MRYFFDLEGDGGAVTDTGGVECVSSDVMRMKAMHILAEVASDTPIHRDRLQLAMRVRDARGTPVYRASLIIEGAVTV